MTTAEYELQAEALRDDGYSEDEIEEQLGARPELPHVDWTGAMPRGPRSSASARRAVERFRPLVLQAIRDWAASHDGQPPSSLMWSSTGDGAHPSYTQVIAICGSWPDAIEEALPGTVVARRRSRGDVETDGARVHSPSMSGPQRRDPDREFHTDAGRRLLRPDDDSEEGRSLLSLLDQFDEDEAEIEAMLAGMPGNGRPAIDSKSVILSRGAKIKRVAEAIARLRGLQWWKLELEQKKGFVKLAALTLDALELVESDQARMKAPGKIVAARM